MKKTRKLLCAVTFVVMTAMLLTVPAFAATGEATVNSFMLNMREAPGTEYLIIDVAYQGNTVLVTQDDGSGWVQVSFHGQTGYMNKLFLTFTDNTVTETYTAPAANTYAAPASVTENVSVPAVTGGSGVGSIKGDGVQMRSGPSLSSSVLNTLYNGTSIQVNGACGAWYEVVYGGQVGYIYGDYVVMSGQTVTYTVTLATANDTAPIYPEPATPEINADNGSTQEVIVEAAPVQETPAEPTNSVTVTPSTNYNASAGQQIVNTAMQYIGTPYVWAGTSPETGFDCSGFVYYVYGQNGYKLNRVAQSMYYNGEDVDLNNLQAGDVLLFGSSVYNIWHTGIYVGDGVFIHSPSTGYTVTTQALSDTYGMRLVAARRIV